MCVYVKDFFECVNTVLILLKMLTITFLHVQNIQILEMYFAKQYKIFLIVTISLILIYYSMVVLISTYIYRSYKTLYLNTVMYVTLPIIPHRYQAVIFFLSISVFLYFLYEIYTVYIHVVCITLTFLYRERAKIGYACCPIPFTLLWIKFCINQRAFLFHIILFQKIKYTGMRGRYS